MVKMKDHLRSALISGLGFGAGFVLGAFLTDLIFTSNVLDTALDLFQGGRLFIGLALTLVVTGLGGAISGTIGGVALSSIYAPSQRASYAWQGALSFGVSYALIVIPLTLFVSFMAYYEVTDIAPIDLMLPLWLFGAVFGAVSGSILGLLTLGRKFWRVALVAAVGFAFGGSGLAYVSWGYLAGVVEGGMTTRMALYAGLFIFGAVGGGSLGYLYSWLAHREEKDPIPTRFLDWFRQLGTVGKIVTVVVLLFLIIFVRALILIAPFPTQQPQLSSFLESNTVGTHWDSSVSLVENGIQPALSASEAGYTAIAWSQTDNANTDIYFISRSNQETDWSMPLNTSNSKGSDSTNPQVVVDKNEMIHLIWVETAEDSEIYYSNCQADSCTPPVPLSNLVDLDCLKDLSGQNKAPSIALDQNNTLMVSWLYGDGNLIYSSWQANGSPPSMPTGCVPTEGGLIGSGPRVTGNRGDFSLVYEQNGQIYLTQFAADSWDTLPELLGPGNNPEIFVDAKDQNYAAWCDSDKILTYWNKAEGVDKIPFPDCNGRPSLTQNENGSPWLIWHANQPSSLIYETFKTETGWSESAVVAQTIGETQPALASSDGSNVHLVWSDDPNLIFASHTAYSCSASDLSDTGQVVFDAVRQEIFRPTTDPIPYCNNQYDRLIYVPNPRPPYSDDPPTPNGPFDDFAELAKTAQYEVVFATMWYEGQNEADNPGRVFASGLAELYQNLKANPSQYPRGITVRILLGNPPPPTLFPRINHPLWMVMEDLRAAGVPELKNDEIGWNVEIANFNASWLHSHVKLMVVDGKAVQVAGYNMQHSHFPTEHSSGRGIGRIDLGMQVTGPVAQQTLLAFDDMWADSTVYHCPNLQSGSPLTWLFTCNGRIGVPNHVPEVLRYYVPDQADNAFSLYRSISFREADEAHGNALASATETIDVIHINFSLELICALNILLEACTFANRVEYMDALMQAIENNDAKVRILVGDGLWVGIENRIAIKAFEDELAARGLSDNVEIRFFNQNVHMKTALIDNEFLIVGNQNFHYSGWGEFSLTEYNLGVEDPQAVDDYQRYFEYYWERAIKRN